MATSFAVRREKPVLIVPEKPTPREIKLLSDIDDQQGLRFHFPVIMFYEETPSMRGKDPVMVIKEALAKALVYYYPFAGRLIEGPNKKLMVDCTAEGVVFVEATAEIRLKQLQNMMLPPCPCSDELLLDVPGSTGMLGCPLWLFQVTRLRCGGFVFAARLNHVMCDGVGIVQFFNAISQLAKGSSSPSPLPIWRRELLTARNPPYFTFMHNEYENVTKNDGIKLLEEVPETLIRQSFFFGPTEIQAIQNQLPQHLQSSSRFELITSFLWRSRTRALELDEVQDAVVSLTFLMNIRGKLFPELPNGYYGNAVISPAAVTKARTLCNNPLGYAVELMLKTKARVNQDYVKSAIDFMVLREKPGFHTRGAWIVSDTSRLGFHEVDFGWGKPIYGGTMDGGSFSYNSLYSQFRNSAKEDGILAPVCLPVSAMDKLKDEVKKLTQEPMEEIRQPKYTIVPSML